MRIEHLQEIVTRIQEEIHCPKCKNSFARRRIDIISVSGKNIEFSGRCDFCDAKSIISAQIGGAKKEIAKEALMYLYKGEPISLETVLGVRETMKTYQGGDVRDLL